MLTRAEQGLLQPKLTAQWERHCAEFGLDIRDHKARDIWYRMTLFSLVHVRSTKDMDATSLRVALDHLEEPHPLGFSSAQDAALRKVGHVAWQRQYARSETDLDFDAWIVQETTAKGGTQQGDFESIMRCLAVEANDDYWMGKIAGAREGRMRWQIKRYMVDLEYLVGHAVEWGYIQGIYDQSEMLPAIEDCPADTLNNLLAMLDTHIRRLCRKAGIRPRDLPTRGSSGGPQMNCKAPVEFLNSTRYCPF